MKLNYKRTFFIGLAFMSICAFWQMYDGIIPLILKDTFLLGEGVTGIIMAADNILAMFMLPLFGIWSDKVKTPLGKRTPFIITGTALAVVSIALLPIADNTSNFGLFVTALAIVLIAMGSYRSPAVALMPDLTPKPLRSKANAIINLMGAIGGIYTLAVISFAVKEVQEGEKADYSAVFALVGGFMVLAVVLLLITVKEKRIAEEISAENKVDTDTEEDSGDSSKHKLEKPVFISLCFILASVFLWFFAYNAVTTAYSRYVGEVWGIKGGGFAASMLVGTAAAIVSYIPIGFISTKFGRKKVILSGIVLMTISYVVAAFLNTYSWVMFLLLILIGFGWAAINVNSYPMVVEMSRGSDTGKYTGIYYTFSMSAQIATPIISGFLIENISYRILFPYAALFSAIAFVTMLFVKHGDSKPEKKKEIIESFDSDD